MANEAGFSPQKGNGDRNEMERDPNGQGAGTHPRNDAIRLSSSPFRSSKARPSANFWNLRDTAHRVAAPVDGEALRNWGRPAVGGLGFIGAPSSGRTRRRTARRSSAHGMGHSPAPLERHERREGTDAWGHARVMSHASVTGVNGGS
jgi:hypothetical protein